MSPESIERLVREALMRVHLDTPVAAASSPATDPVPVPVLATYPDTQLKLACQSSGQKVCNDCFKLTTKQRLAVTRQRLNIGLPDTDCIFCGLASKPESFTKPFLDFLTENPTIFHAVDYFKTKLNAAGFTEVGHFISQAAI